MMEKHGQKRVSQWERERSSVMTRYEYIYSSLLWPLAVAQKPAQARELADRALTLITKATGTDSPLLLQTEFIVGMTLFTTGFVQEALEYHKEVFESRLVRQGGSDHLTLGSEYNVAVCYQNLGNQLKAE